MSSGVSGSKPEGQSPAVAGEAIRPFNLGDLIGEVIGPIVGDLSAFLNMATIPFLVLMIGGCVVSAIYLAVPQLYKDTVGFLASSFFLFSFAGFIAYAVYRGHKLRQKR